MLLNAGVRKSENTFTRTREISLKASSVVNYMIDKQSIKRCNYFDTSVK